MKVALVLLLLTQTLLVRADVLFRGYMTANETTLFVISVGKNDTSGWLSVGDRFNGFSIVAFNPDAVTLTVEKDGLRQIIPIVEGKIRPADSGTSPSDKSSLTITIEGHGTMPVADDPVFLDELRTKLFQIAATTPQPTVRIQAGSKIEARRVRNLLEVLKETGIKGISLRSETEPKTL